MEDTLAPHIFSISGPSLSGKTELVNRLKLLGAVELISHTTRPQRTGEINGVHYNFVSPEEFKALENADKMVQVSPFNGFMYGMSAAEVETKSTHGAPLLWVVLPKSIPQIQKQVEKNPTWSLTKVLIFNELPVLVGRLLERYKNDVNADTENYANRTISVIVEEYPEWTNKEAMKQYQKIITNFSAENEKDVVSSFFTPDSRLAKTHPDFCNTALETLFPNNKKLKMR